MFGCALPSTVVSPAAAASPFFFPSSSPAKRGIPQDRRLLGVGAPQLLRSLPGLLAHLDVNPGQLVGVAATGIIDGSTVSSFLRPPPAIARSWIVSTTTTIATARIEVLLRRQHRLDGTGLIVRS